MSKIKIHIRNNHWKKGFLPCDPEGEKNNTITVYLSFIYL